MPMNPKTAKFLALFATFAVLVATGAAYAQPARTPTDPTPTGEWMVAKQLARIKIADCDGRLWGVVTWEANPGIDKKNPDPNLRTRPTLGMPILLGMAPSKANQWDGRIYNSEDGHTYSANISLLDPNTLRVQGCFLGFLCGGENWTRVEPDVTTTASTQRTPTKSASGNRKVTSNVPEPTDDVCSKTPASTGLSHERGLK